ncbi:hypothetical protein [Streptomyces sp. NPDC002853]
MMIFVAVSELLDGLRALVEHKRKSFRFIGSDSSFLLDFALGKDSLITTRGGGERLVDASPAEDVLAAAFEAAESLLLRHREQLPAQDVARQDLEMSVGALGEFLERPTRLGRRDT